MTASPVFPASNHECIPEQKPKTTTTRDAAIENQAPPSSSGFDKPFKVLLKPSKTSHVGIPSPVISKTTLFRLRKLIVVANNLAPAMLRGETSNGMLLAATSGDRVILLTVDDPDCVVGAKIK